MSLRKKKLPRPSEVANPEAVPAADEGMAEKKPSRFRLPFRKEPEPEVTGIEAGATTILDILSPTSVDYTARDYIIVDGVYHAYLYVTGYGYSTTVGNGWLSPLVEAGEGISLNFLVKRQPKEKILPKISQTTMVNRSRMRDVGDTRQDFEELDSAISAGLYLKNQMNRENEDFYYMHTLLEVTAEDPETLEQRVAAVETRCASVDMLAKRCEFKHEKGFLSFLPTAQIDPDIERKSRRNALTYGVAAAFPFASYEISDHEGIFLGINMHNRTPCFINFFDDYKYTNGNTAIFASSGSGKTFNLQCFGNRLRQQGKKVIFIVPKKGHEYRPLCEAEGGTFIRLSPASTDCINIMDIRLTTLDAYSGIRGLSVRGDSLLADKISKLIIFFSLLKTNLTEEDKNYLDLSLVECYGRKGITFDNDSLYDESGQTREMPILPDWYAVLSERPETRHLAVVLTRFVTGSAKSMGGHTNVDFSNKYIVIDTSGMPDDLELPGIFWATDFATDLIMETNVSLSALISDELWSLVGAGSNPMAANYTMETVKTIRGLGGIAILSSQGFNDMYALENGKYGKGIIDSCRIKIVMQMEEEEARLAQTILNLSDEEVRQITRFRRGEGLLCIGYNHVPIAFHASQKEYDAITTSPSDLRQRMARAAKEGETESA